MRLDHVFCFVHPQFPQEPDVVKAGFTIGFGRKHLHQGTENRLLLVNDGYVEFIWIRDAAEAAANVLRPDLRWRLGGGGGCPLGIGLRGPLPTKQRGEFFAYSLAGFAGRLWVHRECNRAARLPLLFVIESESGAAPAPLEERGYAAHLFAHDNGARAIERIVVRGPDVDAMPRFSTTPSIDLERGPTWCMTVELAADVDRPVEVVTPLSLRLNKRPRTGDDE
jgi:hypothetical protein